MRDAKAKAVLLLCILAVSMVGVVLAGLTLTNRIFTNTMVIVPSENSASQVTIYGNGVTFISYELNVTLQQGTDTIQFYISPNALTDTLTVFGIHVVKTATSEEPNPLIEQGDVIAVYTRDSMLTGKFIGWNDMLLLEVNNGTVMIPGDKITRIVLSSLVQVQGPKILVEVTTDSLPGEYQLKISYLMRGPQWRPVYFVDLNTSSLDCWATIENVETWSNFTLVLVSGGPHIVISGPIYFANLAVPLAASRESVDFTSTTTDEYHEYTYNGLLSFENGTTVRLPLFNGTVTLQQEYFWQTGEVQNRYHISNNLTEPLASGTVEFYRGEKWMGEDSIGYVPVNGEATTIINYAEDITVNATVTKYVSDSHHTVQGTQITAQNHKTVDIQITIQQDTYGYPLNVCTPPATQTGSTLTWTLQVKAGNATTVYYEWEHDW
jgi:hypothetical protein